MFRLSRGSSRILAEPSAFHSGAFPLSPVILAWWVFVAAVFLSLWRSSVISSLSVDVADVCPQPFVVRCGAFLMLKEEFELNRLPSSLAPFRAHPSSLPSGSSLRPSSFRSGASLRLPAFLSMWRMCVLSRLSFVAVHVSC